MVPYYANCQTCFSNQVSLFFHFNTFSSYLISTLSSDIPNYNIIPFVFKIDACLPSNERLLTKTLLSMDFSLRR